MKVSKSRAWSDEEIARRKVGAAHIAHELGRHVTSVRKKANELGLLLSKSTMPGKGTQGKGGSARGGRPPA
jgi:hypothetical protein